MNKKKTVSLLLAMMLVFAAMGTAFAASFGADQVRPGLEGIAPGDSLSMPSNTAWANLTAVWAVKVVFEDEDGTDLQSELIGVSDESRGSTKAPEDPKKSGCVFDGWDRVGGDDPNATLHDDGRVTDITGPGPIVYRAKYKTATGTLTLKKTVKAENGDIPRDRAFKFTIKLTLSNGEPFSGTVRTRDKDGKKDSLKFTDGEATVKLCHGESITVRDIPIGTTYRITEKDYDDIETSASGRRGTITEKGATSSYRNTILAEDGLLSIEDLDIPLAAGLNLQEGYSFN